MIYDDLNDRIIALARSAGATEVKKYNGTSLVAHEIIMSPEQLVNFYNIVRNSIYKEVEKMQNEKSK